MPRRLALIASSLAVTLLLVGCGGDDDSSDDGDTTTTEEEASDTTEETTEPEDAADDTTEPEDDTTTASTEAPDDETTTTAGGDGGGEGGDPEFCAAYGAFDEAADELPDETVEDIQNGADALLAGLEDVAAVAPADLAADVDVLVASVEDLVEAVAGATTVEEAETAGSALFTNEEFQSAAERVDTYFEESCPEANDDQAPASGDAEG